MSIKKTNNIVRLIKGLWYVRADILRVIIFLKPIPHKIDTPIL